MWFKEEKKIYPIKCSPATQRLKDGKLFPARTSNRVALEKRSFNCKTYFQTTSLFGGHLDGARHAIRQLMPPKRQLPNTSHIQGYACKVLLAIHTLHITEVSPKGPALDRDHLWLCTKWLSVHSFVKYLNVVSSENAEQVLCKKQIV